jgi:phosphatidylglycerophosphatase A
MKRTPPVKAPLFLRLTASLFFVGEAAPFAPATFASLLVTPFMLFMMGWESWVQIVVVLASIWIAILISTRAEFYYGHDARAIVIDEVVGMMVTFLLVPIPEDAMQTVLVLVTGFALFRVFDVLKPFPAGRAQNLPKGQGIVMDDVLAAVYANLILRVAMTVLGWA